MARATDPIRARHVATHIVRKLREAGHLAYFAGGCVRDGLLGLHPTDYDVATDAPPKRVRQVFPRTAEVGAAFGVVLVHIAPPDYGEHADGGLVSVEVATFRSDGPYTDARRPDTVRFSDPKSDAERRDFTINALFLDPLAPQDEHARALGRGDLEGQVIDFVGGVVDLKARILRAVGDPEKRLAEDHLRALRAVRFAARLDFALDPATAAAITRSAGELRGVSRERIGEELRRMLVLPSRATAVALLERLTLDAPVLNEPTRVSSGRLLAGLPREAGVTTALAAWVTDRLRVAGATPGAPEAWLSDSQSADIARRWRAALMLSNDETEELDGILRSSWAITQRWGALRISQRKRLAARPAFGKSLQVVRASDAPIAEQVAGHVAAMEADGVGIDPVPLVTGDDLIADGMKPGPRFKGILDEVRDTQLEGGIKTKEEGLELARRLCVQP
jgi:poly(A) polymerase